MNTTMEGAGSEKEAEKRTLTKSVQEFGRASEGVPAQEEMASGRRRRGQPSSDS